MCNKPFQNAAVGFLRNIFLFSIPGSWMLLDTVYISAHNTYENARDTNMNKRI